MDIKYKIKLEKLKNLEPTLCEFEEDINFYNYVTLSSDDILKDLPSKTKKKARRNNP